MLVQLAVRLEKVAKLEKAAKLEQQLVLVVRQKVTLSA